MLKLLLGDLNARKLKRYQPIVSDIQLLEEEIAPLSDDELRARRQLSGRLANAGSRNQRPILDEILPEAFATREVGKRVWGCVTSMCNSLAAWSCMRPDRRDENRRRQNPGRHPAQLPQRPDRSRCAR